MNPRHGTASTYKNYGCRCDLCRSANTEYQRENGYNLTPRRSADRKRKYATARAAGYSAAEAARRRHWSDPLATRGTR